jgi:dihydrofolate reductase
LKIILIAAVARNNVIGKDGKIPWHSSADFKHFKATTLGNPIIMGRKTFESIGKPLPGRLNIVITRNPESLKKKHKGIEVFDNLESAVDFCREQNYEKVFLIGGASVYEEGMKIADEMIISRMKLQVEGDTFFPQFDEKEWRKRTETENEEFSVEVYERIRK